MAKTRLKDVFKDSLGNNLKGKLVITLDDTLIDLNDEPDSILLPVPYEYIVENGLVDVDLYVSNLAKISYLFEFYNLISEAVAPIPAIVDNLGKEIEPGIPGQDKSYSETANWTLRTLVPASLTPISFASLQQTGINIRTDTSAIYEIVAELIRDDNLIETFNQRLFPYKGEFNPDAYYKIGNIVGYEGRQYRFVSYENMYGKYPDDTDYWVKWGGDKGDTGGGVYGEDYLYNPDTWLGKLEAPSKNAVRNVIESLASKVLLNNKANLYSPEFTGSPQVPTPTQGDISKQVVNTEFVNANYSKRVSPALLGVPTAPTQVLSTNNDSLATTAFVKSSTSFDSINASNTVGIPFNTFTNVLNLAYLQDGSRRCIDLSFIVNLINNSASIGTSYEVKVTDSGIGNVLIMKDNLNAARQGALSGSIKYEPNSTLGIYQITLVVNKLENSTSSGDLVINNRYLSLIYIN